LVHVCEHGGILSGKFLGVGRVRRHIEDGLIGISATDVVVDEDFGGACAVGGD
jgi:hypothetical protein